MKSGKAAVVAYPHPLAYSIQPCKHNLCKYKSNICVKLFLVLTSVRGVDFSKGRPWTSFMKGVITPFRKALLRLLFNA